MLCDEIGNLGRIDAFLTAATLLRSWGFTLWTFWQNLAQLQIYGSHANTLIDNAGVVQVFWREEPKSGAGNRSDPGVISGEQMLNLPPDEQILLIEGKLMRCRQTRHYSDELVVQLPCEGA
jgi:type IV secretory pathway TraG/TraD family ATPase VirD4